MIDYRIDRKDFLEYESEIVLSGCIPQLSIPKRYREDETIYWIYDDDENESCFFNFDVFSVSEAETLMSILKSYMLNPLHLVFHPRRIIKKGENWKFHFLPSRRRELYDIEDLKRYLLLKEFWDLSEETAKTAASDSAEKMHALLLKHNQKIEKLSLKNTRIGSDSRCNIVIPFKGSALISRQSTIYVESGTVTCNHHVLENRVFYPLHFGDALSFDEIAAVYL